MTRQKRVSRPALFAMLAFAGLTTLSGCGLLVVGGAAATTAAVATDRRTAGEQLEDQTIQLKVDAEMRKLMGEKPARIHATSYAGVVLLTGDVPTAQDKQQAEQIAAKVEKVKRVVNEIRVGDVTPVSVRTNDSWITSKVTTKFINTKDVPTRTITITTERGIVYLMGKVTSTEGQLAATAASSVSGVNKVVKLFEIVARETLLNEQSPAPIQNAPTSTPGSVPGTGTGISGDVQTLPIQ